MRSIGGHPYLVRLAFYHLSLGEQTLEQVLAAAPTNAGIYEEHLRQYVDILQRNPMLDRAFAKVVNTDEPIIIDTIPAYQLYSMGLVKRSGDKLIPSCQLYTDYFRFSNEPG